MRARNAPQPRRWCGELCRRPAPRARRRCMRREKSARAGRKSQLGAHPVKHAATDQPAICLTNHPLTPKNARAAKLWPDRRLRFLLRAGRMRLLRYAKILGDRHSYKSSAHYSYPNARASARTSGENPAPSSRHENGALRSSGSAGWAGNEGLRRNAASSP